MTDPATSSGGSTSMTAPSKAIEDASPMVTVTKTVNGTTQTRTSPVPRIQPIPVDGKRGALWSLFESGTASSGGSSFKCIACTMGPQVVAGGRMQKHLEDCTSFHWKEREIDGAKYSIVPQHLAAKRSTEGICVWVDDQGLFELPIHQAGRRPTASGPPAAMRSIQESALFAENKKRKADLKPIDAFLDRAMPEHERNAAVDLFVSFMIECNLAWNILASVYLHRFFQAIRPTFKMVTPKVAASTVLQRLADSVNRSVEKTLVDLAFFTLVSDGWSNLRNESLVNYVFTEALSGTSVLFDVVSYGVNRHTAATILASIEMSVLAPLKSKGDNVFYKLVAYVTDSASNYKSARNLLERAYPHILALPCLSHWINLIVGDFLKLHRVKTVIEKALKLINFFRRTQLPMDHLRSLLPEAQRHFSFELPCATRWGTFFTALHKLESHKALLLQVAGWMSGQVANNQASNPDAWMLTVAIIQDTSFWADLNSFIVAIRAPSALTLVLESSTARLSHFVRGWAVMRQSIVSLSDSPFHVELVSIIDKRWEKIYHPAYILAYAVDPKCRAAGIKTLQIPTLLCLASDFFLRFDPTGDVEKFMLSFSSYLNRTGSFDNDALDQVLYISTVQQWWLYMQDTDKELSMFALRLLSIPCSAADAERCWSLFSLIHTKSRNRLRASSVIDIAKVKWQLKSESRKSKKADVEALLATLIQGEADQSLLKARAAAFLKGVSVGNGGIDAEDYVSEDAVIERHGSASQGETGESDPVGSFLGLCEQLEKEGEEAEEAEEEALAQETYGQGIAAHQDPDGRVRSYVKKPLTLKELFSMGDSQSSTTIPAPLTIKSLLLDL